jgi:hypothetical protein
MLPRAVVVVAGVVVAVGASAVGVALTGSTPAHPSHSATPASSTTLGPATQAAGSGASTTVAPVSSTTLASTGRTAGAPPTTTAPVATSTTMPPRCQWSDFAVAVSSSYTGRAPVPFTVTVTNVGPTCADAGQAHCLCWNAFVEMNSTVVWDLADSAHPPVSGDSVASPPPLLERGWSTSQQMTWDGSCTSCSGSDAGPGPYRLYGEWAYQIGSVSPSQSDPDGRSAIVSDPVTVQLTS